MLVTPVKNIELQCHVAECELHDLFGPKDVYKFMTFSPKDYYLIPGNGAKNLFGPKDVYKFMTLSPKDYYLIPGSGAKKLVHCVPYLLY